MSYFQGLGHAVGVEPAGRGEEPLLPGDPATWDAHSSGGSDSSTELLLPRKLNLERGRFCNCDDSAAFGVAGGNPLRRAQSEVNPGLYIDSLIRLSRYPEDDQVDLLIQREVRDHKGGQNFPGKLLCCRKRFSGKIPENG